MMANDEIKSELRERLGIARPPEDDEAIDLGLEMIPPRVSGGTVIPRRPKATRRNLDRILRGDPVFAGTIRWNELAQHIEWGGKPIEDYRVSELGLAIAERHEVEFAIKDIHDLIEVVARENVYHPVRSWLSGLEWDGTQRLDTWLTRYLAVEDTPLTREYARRFCIGAVARVMDPGCKMDVALVLHGVQSAGKSSFCKAFAQRDEWFADTRLEWDSKDRYQQIQGVWIYEMGELSGMGKADMNSVKNFLTSQLDKFRPSYARHHVTRKRQCVFIGTTNDPDCLSDPTGDRRFWVVTVALPKMGIDLELVRNENPQLWAEAVEAYRAGEPWYLSREFDELRSTANEAYRREDPLLSALAKFASERPTFTPREFWTSLDLQLHQLTPQVVARIGTMMNQIGTHDRIQYRVGATRVRGYRVKPEGVTWGV